MALALPGDSADAPLALACAPAPVRNLWHKLRRLPEQWIRAAAFRTAGPLSYSQYERAREQAGLPLIKRHTQVLECCRQLLSAKVLKDCPFPAGSFHNPLMSFRCYRSSVFTPPIPSDSWVLFFGFPTKIESQGQNWQMPGFMACYYSQVHAKFQ